MTYITLLNVDSFLYVLLLISIALWNLKSIYESLRSIYQFSSFIEITSSLVILIIDVFTLVVLYDNMSTITGTIFHILLLVAMIISINIWNYKYFIKQK